MATIKVGISKSISANQKYSSKIKFQAKRYGITIQDPQNNLPKNNYIPRNQPCQLVFHPTSETLSRLRERAILMWGAPGMNPGIPYYLTTNSFSSVRSLPHWRCVLKSASPMWCVLCSCSVNQTVGHCAIAVTE